MDRRNSGVWVAQGTVLRRAGDLVLAGRLTHRRKSGAGASGLFAFRLGRRKHAA